MADEVSPKQTRARQFDVARRGYDRAQVDAYLDELRDELVALEAAVGEASSEALALGIDDREALAKELGRIGAEISTILEAARSAAEGIRTRASADAEKWRSEAKAETSAALSATKEQTQTLRSSAWNEGTALLNSAVGEAAKIKESAQQDALFMRAEAERDALRLTSDARRDREEALRSARQEAEVIVAEARTESDGVLAAAQKQAEMAQERARALEDRRSELLAELEATRASISHLEDEIDSRRQELETPPEPEPEIRDEERHHGLDVGSVKIVAPSKAVTLRPVDPDELVAEVTALRASSAERAAAAERQAPDTVAVISPPDPVPAEPTQTAPEPSPEPSPEPPDDAEEVETPVAVAESSEAATKPESADGAGAESKGADEIGSLFAALRSVDTDASPVTPESPDTSGTEPEGEPDPPGKDAAPLENVASVDESEGGSDDPSATEVLGIRNDALKDIKRGLVELQNETLEALRTDEEWTPPDDFTDRFEKSFVAVGSAVGGASDGSNEADAFASDLQDSVLSAIEDARNSGKGSRAVAAAASKVFRTWRSDEAERRLQRL